MDFTTLKKEDIEKMIKILQDLFNGKYGNLSDHNKSVILKDLRDAKLEHILNR